MFRSVEGGMNLINIRKINNYLFKCHVVFYVRYYVDSVGKVRIKKGSGAYVQIVWIYLPQESTLIIYHLPSMSINRP